MCIRDSFKTGGLGLEALGVLAGIDGDAHIGGLRRLEPFDQLDQAMACLLYTSRCV